jgi:DNA-binding NarL/FixJ family response regulator
MPVMNGLEVSRRIRSLRPRTEVLILTMHESEEILTEACWPGSAGSCSNPMPGSISFQRSRSCSVIVPISPAPCWRNCSSIIGMRKLGMSSTAELVRYAIRKKLVAL